MLTKKTLFVLGAGASSEANLLTGHELKKEIADFLDIRFERGYDQVSGDRYIVEALRIYARQTRIPRESINPHLNAACRIQDAMPQAISIDSFIDTHNDDKKIELCGKLAIVRSILKTENDSLLYFDTSNSDDKLEFSALETTWYASFMKLLTENCTREDLPKRLKSISLVIFNYDRCIEHFLFNSLRNYYGIQPQEAGNLVGEIEIYHPYGVVGNLPWQGGQSVAFGAEPYPKQLLELVSQIKTFTEGTDPKASKIIAIRKCVSEANTIVFLG